MTAEKNNNLISNIVAAAGVTVFIVVLQALLISVLAALFLHGSGALRMDELRSQIVLIAGEGVMAAILWIWFRQRQNQESASHEPSVDGNRHYRSIKLLLPVIGVLAVMPLVTGLFDDGFASGGLVQVVVVFTLLALAISFSEELAFRGVVWRFAAGDGARQGQAILITSVLFGLVHLPLLVEKMTMVHLVNAVGVTLGVAIPFAVVRAMTGSLAGPIVAHALIDYAAFTRLGAPELPSTMPPSQAALVITASLVLCSAYGVLWFIRGRVQKDPVGTS